MPSIFMNFGSILGVECCVATLRTTFFLSCTASGKVGANNKQKTTFFCGDASFDKEASCLDLFQSFVSFHL